MNSNKIRFEKASTPHQAIIFQWLVEPHITAILSEAKNQFQNDKYE